ncbi:MAG: butyrate kinase [Prevotellaceae bacterium]|jgi:butyrate kinase|nr:butyrate kinase [Prevotellaceae bacterium]
MYKILVINPGSTSTKIAVFEDKKNIYEKTLRHSTDELVHFPSVASQYEFREKVILDFLNDEKIDTNFDIIVGRGGMLKPIEAGAYEVNEAMIKDLLSANYGEHACSLGALVGQGLARRFGCKIIIADPVVTDEMQEIARVSGHPLFPRISTFHCLNHKAIARCYAQEIGKKYEDLNLVIAHIGGGVSVAAHCKGKVIDTNNALGFGPFSPERSGTLPSVDLVKLCFSGEYTKEEFLKMCNGKGGLIAHLNTNSGLEVEKMIENGDQHADLVYNAMAYNIAKEIGALSTVFNGKVNAILITGGIAYGKTFVDFIKKMVEFIAPVKVYPGEDELLALAQHGVRVLNGEEEAKEYK